MSEALTHPYDHAVAFTDKEINLLNKAQQVVDEAEDQWYAMDAASELRRTIAAGGVALALLMFGTWAKFYANDPSNMTGAKWSEFITDYSTRTGFAEQTVRKYTELWYYVLQDHPELREKPIGGLLLITPAAKEQQLEDQHWDQLAGAHNKKDIREVIKEVRGWQTSSKTAVTIIIDEEGRIHARQGEEPYQPVGLLIPNPDFEAGKVARARIINASGIVEV